MKYCRKEDDVLYHTMMTNTKTKTKTKTDKFPVRMGQCLQVVSSPWSCIKAEMSLAHDTHCPVSTSRHRQRQGKRQRQRQNAQKTQYMLCFFEKHGVQGYQNWHSDQSTNQLLLPNQTRPDQDLNIVDLFQEIALLLSWFWVIACPRID